MVLQTIREKISGILAFFILGILVIPFAFVGVSSYFQSDSVNVLALVNEQEITVTEFNNSFQNYRRRMQSMLGNRYDPAMFDQPIVRRQHLDDMIDRELLEQVSVESGLAVDDAALAQAIRTTTAFEVDGEFNQDVYASRLASMGTTPRQYEESVRASLVVDQYPSTIQGSAIATDWELNRMVSLTEEAREFKAIVVPAEAAAVAIPAEGEEAPPEQPEAPVSDEEIQAFYDENQDLFRNPERVVIEYVELDVAVMDGQTDPDEDQLRTRFEEQESRFITPESRLASHILIEVPSDADDAAIEEARREAEELAERARAGEEFAALATEFSDDTGSAATGGDLDWVEPGFMVQAFEDGLYALSMERPISDPVQTGFGWHVIQLREIRPAEGMSFDEAREILLEEYYAEENERRFLEQADRLVDLVYEDPTTLETAADLMGLEILTAGPFSRAGEEDSIASNREVVDAAFSDLVLLQGSVSDPVDIGENHMVMLRLREHLPEDVKPLDEVRDEVADSVRYRRSMDEAAERANALMARVLAGEDISELAAAEGLTLAENEGLERNSVAVSGDLRDAIFAMESPAAESATTQVAELSNGHAVIQLYSVSAGEFDEEAEIQRMGYSRRIQSSTSAAEAIAFLRMLRSQSVIEVFEDRL